MDRSSKQKINKERQVLNDILDKMDLINYFRWFNPNAEEYTFFSNAHEPFSRIDHILGHKSNISKFMEIWTISSIFSNHNAMRLDINYKKKKNCKKHKHMEIKQYVLNNQQVTEEIKREIKKKTSRSKWQWKHDNSKPMGCSKSSPKRKVYSNTILSQETRKTSDNLTLNPKQQGKEQKKPKIIRRKEIIKIWAVINEKEMKETRVNINKTKSWFFEKINKIDKPLVRLIKKKKRK